MTRATGRRPSLAWQLARLALAGSRRQAFLDHRWIGWLLRLTPRRRRRFLSLRILSLSPHYFIYQWDRYPADWSRHTILEAENERNVRSRRQIADHVLAPAISGSTTVLDFGCGPGYLAASVAGLANEVIGVDVSAGALACARVLNAGPSYRLNGRSGKLPVSDGTVDVVYSIAVFQHLDPADWSAHFAEFARVLRPGGQGVCHIAIAERDPVAYHEPRGPRACYSLRFEEHRSDDVVAVLSAAGFTDVRVQPITGEAGIEDDVGGQHVVTFTKPA